MITGYTIAIDENEQFITSQASKQEDYRWQFQHDGKQVTGHFETFGRDLVARHEYELTIDGDRLGPGDVKVKGHLFVLIVIPFGAAFVFFLVDRYLL